MSIDSESPEDILASFTAQTEYQSLPEAAVTASKNAILDCLGVTLAGSQEKAGRIQVAMAEELGGKPTSSIIGGQVRTSPVLAALVNGTMAHALDYDDVSDSWIGHPSPALVPAILAVAERCQSSGKDVLTAYITGFEVGAKLGIAFGQDHYARGWHTTGTIGSLAGAVAAARLLKLDSAQTKMALGIATSLASGIRENFGSMTKPLHAGSAARNGVLAGLLAEKGFTATENSLTGQAGFARVLGKDRKYDLSPVFRQMGAPFDVVSPGVWLKAYPSGAATQSSITAALRLRREHTFDTSEIAEIICATNRAVPQILIHHHPGSGLEGKFSLEYCVAVALLDGEVSLDQFTDDRALADDVQKLVSRVKYEHPPEMENRFGFHIPGILTVRLQNGEELSSRVDYPRGRPENPMSQSEIHAKFENCAKRVLAADKIACVIDFVSHLEEQKELRSLMDLLMSS